MLVKRNTVYRHSVSVPKVNAILAYLPASAVLGPDSSEAVMVRLVSDTIPPSLKITTRVG